ncbi:hypothetical protein BU26DRAFT_534674 [Trematosphaeria pertusa]|uniref:N-acetyltransferase domain-containing protein n=1 Tax=Trematosphaeria pertusa TaxID=390896 RepID=A0A6A6HX70_9PLEO|nr:uncharacterized protein BU26DRAFT_534674 [Trematosphaeria pertusa]KAF2242637.1 hypothetical protein BU26DRAFT_534674 [Trematosphaeria pertusa]
MPLELHPVVESDFPDFVRIQVAAFNNGMTAYLVPRPVSEDWIEKSVDKHIKCFRAEPDCRFLKVIDTEQSGRMIAVAKWRINEKERTEEQIQPMLPVPGEEQEGNPAAQDFMWYLNRVRREFMGTKPFYFLHLLVTHPEHQRRGAGAMLVRWGIEQADKVQLPSFLEATEVGRPLYASLGFNGVHEEIFDLSKYGSQGRDRSTVMIRHPPN